MGESLEKAAGRDFEVNHVDYSRVIGSRGAQFDSVPARFETLWNSRVEEQCADVRHNTFIEHYWVGMQFNYVIGAALYSFGFNLNV